MNLDKLFGVHSQAAQLRSYRGEVLANNIANSETPGYKSRDVDFKSILNKAESSSVNLETSHNSHIKITSSSSFQNEVYYRAPTQPSLDGNTVDMDIEKSEFSKNSVSYQVSMSFLSGKIKGMMAAIRGEG